MTYVITGIIQQVEPSDQDPSSFQPKFEQVKLKNEKAESDLIGSSGCDFDARPDCSFDRISNKEFELDRIALAQSKLTEDWSPDSEQQKNETESLDPGPSLGNGLNYSHHLKILSLCWFPGTDVLLLMNLYIIFLLYFINTS